MRVAMVLFLGGMLAMGYLIAALFFLRYWRRTRERLFASFAVALLILAIQRALLAADLAIVEDRTWYYGLRLLAFVIILLAILDKNRGDR
jgi:alpha-D-ribose 1-methylphosphonate 5-triphosphate synthase subunit PhnI